MKNNMPVKLDSHDSKLCEEIRATIDKSYREARVPVALAKRIASIAMRYRNKGRKKAEKNYPFQGICEASGKPLSEEDKCLDEMQSEKGYSAGNIRWVCPKANNSGRRSCGGC